MIKEQLHKLVDELSEQGAEAALVIVERRRDDPMLGALPALLRTTGRQVRTRRLPLIAAVRQSAPRICTASSSSIKCRLVLRGSGAGSRPRAARPVDALDRFVADPRTGDIRKLSSSQWRLRVGEWRVRFSFDEERRVTVVCGCHRADAPMIDKRDCPDWHH
jgi:hypothetical protein